MLYVALGELLVIVALVAAIVYVVVSSAAADERREEAWRDERDRLLERIQRPELRPPAKGQVARRRNQDPRELPGDLQNMARIGSVVPATGDRDPDPA